MPMSKATTTPLINEIFQECFNSFMDKSITEVPNETKACGSCIYCRNNIHFNGIRVCLKDLVKLDETNEDICEEKEKEIKILEVTKSNISPCASKLFIQTETDGFAWINESVGKFGNKQIYDRVQAEDEIWKNGNFFYFEDQIGQIVYFFEKRYPTFC